MDYWIHVCLVPVTKYFGLDKTADGYLHVFLPSFNYSESVSFGLVLSSFWDEISYTPGWPLNCGITGMTMNSWPSSVCLPCWDYRHHIHSMQRWGPEPRLSTLAARQAPVLQLSHSPCRPRTLSCFHAFSRNRDCVFTFDVLRCACSVAASRTVQSHGAAFPLILSGFFTSSMLSNNTSACHFSSR